MDTQPSYILGLDLGANSLGWALLRAEPDAAGEKLIACGIERLGTRVFEAGVTGDLQRGREESRAVARRQARLQRRQLWRRAWRLGKVFGLLQRAGLLPCPEGFDPNDREARHRMLCSLDVELREGLRGRCAPEKLVHAGRIAYLLRARALDDPLTPPELGRALYHLAQRRGFQSNRKMQRGGEDVGVVKAGISQLDEAMRADHARTLGEYFAGLDPHTERYRGRWTSRRMYQDEFELIWAAQQPHHPEVLTPEFKAALYDAMFHQRPLKPVLPGNCDLERGQVRAPWALPDAQRLRLLQRVNDLRLLLPDETSVELLPEHRRILADALETQAELSLTKVRKLLKLPKDVRLDLEEGGEKKLVGNKTSAALRAVFGDRWAQLPPADRNRLVEKLLELEQDEDVTRYAREEWGLDPDAATALLKVNLQPGYCRFSRPALRKLVTRLEQGMALSTAIKEAYPEQRRWERAVDFLPPVRQVLPELLNPTVLRSLTELRRVMNAIIRRWGKPVEIRIELARDLKRSRDERAKIALRQDRRKREREAASREIVAKCVGLPEPKRADVEKWLLADECGWTCPYTSRRFGVGDLFGPEPQVDVEHIIPFDRSLDDSFANKTLCFADENRSRKRNQTPFEAYSYDETKWEAILDRVSRFKGDARREKLRRFRMDHAELEQWLKDFDNRRLNDTRYASKLAVRYLSMLYGGSYQGVDASQQQRIFATNGQATALLRSGWGLHTILGDGGEKQRSDHRHHAIDALVVALTSRTTFQAFSIAASKARGRERRLSRVVEAPWDGFLSDVFRVVETIVVSHRVNHKLQGPLHKDTLYSFSAEGVHRRKALSELSTLEVQQIVDPVIRARVEAALNGGDPKQVFQSAQNLPYLEARDGRRIPIHRVRIRMRETVTAVGQGARLRHVVAGNNNHLEVVETTDARGRVRWEGWVLSRLEAFARRRRKEAVVQRDHGSDRRFVFSLMNGDTVEIDEDEGGKGYYVVANVSPQANGRVDMELVRHTDARSSIERRTQKARFRPSLEKLRQRNCRKVTVDPLGEVFPCHD